ncbi:MAG: sensor domain-containing protein [Mycobacterium sp.]
MRPTTAALLALSLTLAGCSNSGTEPPSTPELVSAAALDKALLSQDEIDTIMGTTGMTAHRRVEAMADHRNLLPNLNCLGIWQVNEAGVYGQDGWSALRQELLRSPDADDWQNLVVQSAVNYPSQEAARIFFNESADRWSKCTNHNVNITLNGQRLPKWRSGDLTTTADRLAIPFTRENPAGSDSCQRVLSVSDNVIVDVQACKRDGSRVRQASAIADRIEANLAQ